MIKLRNKIHLFLIIIVTLLFVFDIYISIKESTNNINKVYSLRNKLIIGFYEIFMPQTHNQDFGACYNKSLHQEFLRKNIKIYNYGFLVKTMKPYLIKTNSFGIRDKEYNITKPNNTTRIIALGDSFTFGLGVEANQTYVKILEKILNNKSNKKKYEVMNFGEVGYNTKNEVVLFRLKGLQLKPNVVIVQFLDNDDLNNAKVREIQMKLKSENPKLTLNKLDSKLRSILYSNYKSNISNWNSVEDSITDLKNLSIRYNFTVIVVAFRNNKIANQKLSKLTDRLNISFFELKYLKYVSEKNRFKFQVNPLDSHPNAYAHKLIANEIYNYLIENKLIKK